MSATNPATHTLEAPAIAAPAAKADSVAVNAPVPLLKMLLLHALALGSLAALAEVSWAYYLPRLLDGWRAMLPATAGGLSLFILAAVATDVVVVLVGALALAGLFGLLGKVLPRWRASPRAPGLARALMVGGALAYVGVGWLGIFLLVSDQSRTWKYRATIGGALLGSMVAGLFLSWVVTTLRRRVHRIVPAAAWLLAAVALLTSALPNYHTYQAAEASAVVSIAPSAPANRPNVLLFTLDTLRADFVGCYGNQWVKTPHLDALAAEGTVFDVAISQAPTTGPSHCSIMTSLYPNDHEGFNGKPMKAGLTTIADVMHANAYETVAFTSSTTTRSLNTGLQQGFDAYVDSLVPWSTLFSRDEFQNLIFFYLAGIAQHSEIRGEVVTDRAVQWLDRRTDKPFFAWLHYFDPHGDYAAPAPYLDMYMGRVSADMPMAAQREAYAGEVSYTDAQVGRVIDELKKRNLYENTIIVVTSDHGEGFGEPHVYGPDNGHGANLYDATQHVPLIVRGPAGRGKRIAEQVELSDIAPTILAAIGIDQPAAFRGKPLVELLEGRRYSYPLRPAYAFTTVGIKDTTASTELRFGHKMAMRTPQLKYVTTPAASLFELYDLIRDPREATNVAEQFPGACRERHDILLKFLADKPLETGDPRAKVAPALVKQLQTLGYMGGDEEEDEAEQDDQK